MHMRPTGPTGTAMAKPMASPLKKVTSRSTPRIMVRAAPVPGAPGRGGSCAPSTGQRGRSPSGSPGWICLVLAAYHSSEESGWERALRERTLESVRIPIAEIYVPVKRKQTLNQAQVDELAQSIMEEGLKRPISVRKGNGRYVLQEGLHRLEACRAFGEDTIESIIVRARQH